MESVVHAIASGAPVEQAAGGAAPAPDLNCRVCELETENTRLRLLVGELLTANQRLREEVKIMKP